MFSGDCVSKHSKCTLYCNLAVAMVAQDKIPHAQQLVGQALLALPNAAPALLIVRPAPASTLADARALFFCCFDLTLCAGGILRAPTGQHGGRIQAVEKAAGSPECKAGRRQELAARSVLPMCALCVPCGAESADITETRKLHDEVSSLREDIFYCSEKDPKKSEWMASASVCAGRV